MSTIPEALADECIRQSTNRELDIGTAWNLLDDAGVELRRLAAENAELRDAARVNLENYEFQRNKADQATATVYTFHYAMKDAGWHPGRTDDKLTDIIRVKGKEMAELRAEVEALRRGEFICGKCGLRKDADAGPVPF